MKEKALTQTGVDDEKEIKDSMYQSLSEEKIKGFESRERLLQRIILETEKDKTGEEQRLIDEIDITGHQLDERTYLGYQASQQKLLDKLLGSSYFL